MRAKHKQRLAIIISGVVCLIVVVLLVMNALRSNIVHFFTPTDVHEGKVNIKNKIRIGGMIKKGTLKRSKTGLAATFIVTDFNKEVRVHSTGILPNLIRDGQGVVVEGRVQSNKTFKATRVLAKHNEEYMPPEVADALKKGKKKAGMSMSTLVDSK